jgi:hypothetical protein
MVGLDDSRAISFRDPQKVTPFEWAAIRLYWLGFETAATVSGMMTAEIGRKDMLTTWKKVDAPTRQVYRRRVAVVLGVLEGSATADERTPDGRMT